VTVKIVPVQAGPLLEVSHLSKTFDGKAVLNDVSFSVDKGQVVVVLGPSGAGKSTLLRAINWLEAPSSGTISVLGHSVSVQKGSHVPERDVHGLRNETAMVFQNFGLWPHLTALQNVCIAPLRVKKRPRGEVVPEAEALLARVGLADKANAFPSQLSGGQKQRVGIARALAMRPSLLLLDEPTSALDPELVGEVLTVIKDLAARHTSMLVVTHEIGFAREIADRVLFLENGVLVEDQNAKDFFFKAENPRVEQFLARHR
jgi:ABC-type polar amino acid transport system ATPase subunit